MPDTELDDIIAANPLDGSERVYVVQDIIGTPHDRKTTTADIAALASSTPTTPGGSSGQVQYNNAGAFGGLTVGGDGTLNTGTGALTVTKTNGVSFGSFATVTPTGTPSGSKFLRDDNSWQTPPGGSPGGTSGQYQYNNGGAFAGIGLILFADTTFYVRYNLGTVTMTIASPCVVSKTAHGLLNDDPVVFSTSGALPTGLTAGTVYYVVNKNTDDFQVSATVGGAAINTSGSQSGTHTAATGNDSNDGSAATRAAAWLTIQHACDYMAGVDANTYGVTVQVADSTYKPASPGSYCVSILYRPRNSTYFYILGNTTTPANVVIDGINGSPYGVQVGANYDTQAVAMVIVDRFDGFKVKNAYSYVTANGHSVVNISDAATEDNSIVIEAYNYSTVNMNRVAFSGTSDYAVYSDVYTNGGFNNVTFATGSTINNEVFYLYSYSYFFASNTYTNLTAGTDYYVGPFSFLDTSGTSGSIPGAAGTVDALGKVA